MRTLTIPILGTKIRVLDRDASYLEFLPELRGKLIRGDGGPVSISMFGPKPKKELSLGILRRGFFTRQLDVTEDGVLLSRRVVTDAGVSFLCTDWLDGSKDITNFNAHANGTGATAEAAANTALVTEVGTRAAGTKSKPTAPQLQTVGTIAQGATAAITEHGLFDSVTAAGSTLWDRSVFAAINVNSGDGIQFTYTLTVTSGG